MREDHLESWAWWVVVLSWRVKKGGKLYSGGNVNGADEVAMVSDGTGKELAVVLKVEAHKRQLLREVERSSSWRP